MEAGTPDLIKLEDLQVPGTLTGRKHVLSILVENKAGVLARISGLFARRGFNIDTLAVGPTDDPNVSRVTLTLDGAVHPIDQVTKQLHKLVNVLKIRDMEPDETIAREMALFKVTSAVESRAEIMQFAEIFRAKIVDVSRRTMTIEVTGSADKVEAFGATGMRCEDDADLEEMMGKALEIDGPVLVDVRVSPKENCYPMIPAGAAARDMVG